ncbi:sensor domain-containing diguanylate cyclase [Clostridium sp. ZS2-4]|uniref:sensor domain-containing diguanylate cyclase n=1 Tax=Clostridium sp. ZS2-4 TaxID=2987703 RepID=UPI00227D27F4|nr:diguanylate cyclase [Clostridium sp. ZS2-4]MCY6355675.1 diguanylate cyclase [Clostridium sp. ZS2-4]
MSLFNFIFPLFRSKKRKVFSNRCNEICCNPEEKKLTQNELRKRELRLKCAQEIGNLGSWEWDYKSNRLDFSDEIYEIFGMDKGKFQGDFEYIMHNVIHGNYKNMIEEMLVKKADLQIINPIEFKIVKPNREERWIRANGVSIYDDNGNKIKMIGAIQDVTEWKNAEIALQENLEFLQTLMDTIPNPIFYKDEKGVYKYTNIAHAEYVGLRQEEIIGKTVYEISSKQLADIYHKADIELMKNKGKQVYEAKVRYNDGLLHDAMFTKTVFTNKENEVKGIVGVILDITERKIIEERIDRLSKVKDAMLELNQSITGIKSINELFQLIIEKINQLMGNDNLICILLLDEEENLKIAASRGYDNEKAKEYTIKLKETFAWIKTKGKIEKAIIINDVQEILKKQLPRILENKQDITIQSSISTPIIIEEQLYGFINIDSEQNYIYDEKDLEIMEYMRKQIEISISKHRLYEETVYLSRYDKLTNVYNRRYFEELIYEYIYKSRINSEEFFFVVFDLNGLKVVNDTYGHLVGDEFIKTFTSSLSKYIGDLDILARLGGDEFVGVFFNRDLKTLIERFEELIIHFQDNLITFEENKFICSYSYGIASFPKDGEQYDKLMKIADERMYKYKQKIKNSKAYLKGTSI